MSKFANIIGIAAGVVLAGVAIGWLVSRPQSQTSVLSAENSSPSAGATSPVRDPLSATTPKGPGKAGERTPTETASVPAPANVVTNWEEKIDEILGSEKEDRDKARLMLELFPLVPNDGQAEVAQHLANLTANEDYAALAQLLTRGGLSDAAQDVLMADVLNRPNSLKLPALLEVARDPQNGKAGEAKEVLQLFLEEDLGTDWTAWQMKMEQWLKDNPD